MILAGKGVVLATPSVQAGSIQTVKPPPVDWPEKKRRGKGGLMLRRAQHDRLERRRGWLSASAADGSQRHHDPLMEGLGAKGRGDNGGSGLKGRGQATMHSAIAPATQWWGVCDSQSIRCMAKLTALSSPFTSPSMLAARLPPAPKR